MDGTQVIAQLIRNVQTGMARREQHVTECAVPVELEAAVDGVDALDARAAHAAIPAAPRPQLRDVGEELVHCRVVAVAQRVEERAR